jgi:uncharacterized Zn finger protein
MSEFSTVDRPNLNIDLESCENLLCHKCGNATFEQVRMIKKVSALVSPNGKEGYVPVPIFACNACGEVPPEFLTKKVKSALEM